MIKTVFFWTNYYIECPEIGTTAKIRAEILSMRKLGYDVTYTAYLTEGVAIYNNNDERVCYKKIKTGNTVAHKISKKNALIDIAREYLVDRHFDYCLLRINELNRKYVEMLKLMRKSSFVMIESLSYFPNMKFSDVKGIGYYVMLASIKRNKNRLKNYVDLMLTEGQINDFYGVPCIEFGMGIDVERFRAHKYNGDKNELNLLMVGCASIYHGTDRIINSLIEYYKQSSDNRTIKLHLVGNLLRKDEELLDNPLIKDKVIVYGKKHGIELENIYDLCNIGLGPLAQHRMKKKDTGLKTKEYFAKGIPYIYSGEEVLIENEYPFIMKVADSEELIDLNKVMAFYDAVKKVDNVPQLMRDKAQDVFSWEKIFQRVFDKANLLRGNEKC